MRRRRRSREGRRAEDETRGKDNDVKDTRRRSGLSGRRGGCQEGEEEYGVVKKDGRTRGGSRGSEGRSARDGVANQDWRTLRQHAWVFFAQLAPARLRTVAEARRGPKHDLGTYAHWYACTYSCFSWFLTYIRTCGGRGALIRAGARGQLLGTQSGALHPRDKRVPARQARGATLAARARHH